MNQQSALMSHVANLGQTRQTMSHNRELFDEIVRLFLTEAPVLMQDIQHGVAVGNAESVRRDAHELKGMAGVFLAERTMQAAARVECDAASPVAVSELQQSLAELVQAIESYEW